MLIEHLPASVTRPRWFTACQLASYAVDDNNLVRISMISCGKLPVLP